MVFFSAVFSVDSRGEATPALVRGITGVGPLVGWGGTRGAPEEISQAAASSSAEMGCDPAITSPPDDPTTRLNVGARENGARAISSMFPGGLDEVCPLARRGTDLGGMILDDFVVRRFLDRKFPPPSMTPCRRGAL